MKSWLTYICLFAGCIMTIPSCTNEEVIDVDTNKTSVELTLSYAGGGPMSRDVGSKDDADGLDYTTEEQCALDINDIFILAFETGTDASGKETLTLLDIVKDLTLVSDNDGLYYTQKIKGTMPQQGANKYIKFVVLTNLVQNGIVVDGTTLGSKVLVETYLNGKKGASANSIYEELIYNYDAINGNKWIIESRRIPMWGISTATTLDQREINMPNMFLYRAVAKVQIWVNNKQGIAGSDDTTTDDEFIIKSIIVKNANAQGYCVSKETPDPNINIQYTAASVPTTVNKQSANIIYTPTDGNVTYEIDGGSSVTLNAARQAYSDFIYLPEQINIDSNTPITIDVVYSYNKKEYTGTINFKVNGTGDAFDVIRNHSYIFNINKIEEVTGVIYYVVDEWESATVNIPFN